LLKEAIPGLAGALFNPANPATELVLSAMRLAAQSLKVELSGFGVREVTALEAADAPKGPV
jgi:hypothetical protein